MREIFLDNNATTEVLPDVIAAITSAMSESFGNPSSANRAGARSRQVLQNSREALGDLIGAAAESIYFTSGATESNNWVIQQWCSKPGSSLVTTNIEHSSIKVLSDFLECQGTAIRAISPNQGGRIDPQHIADAIEPSTTLVSVHWINNETGVIQPVEEIARICRERHVLFHTDASQTVGKLRIDVNEIGCDFLSFSAHKFHGPQGVGGLFIRPGVKLSPMIFGGSQEFNLRAGTENLPGIAGAGAAAAQRIRDFEEAIGHMRRLRDRLEVGIIEQIPDVIVNGDVAHRVCNTTNLRFDGIDGEALVAQLDQNAIYCSQSSACTNQRPEPSYVLREMGLTESQAYASIRFSVSVTNSEEQIDQTVQILAELVSKLRRFGELTATND